MRTMSPTGPNDRLTASSHEGRLIADRLYGELGALVRDNPDARRASFGSLASAHQFARLYAITEEHVPDGAKVRDWGCGSGHFSYYLAQAGHDVTAFSLFPCPLAHNAAVTFGEGVRRNALVEWVTVDEVCWSSAWEIFTRYDDKDFSFTDCTSFAIMQVRQLQDAFAFDQHFV